MNVRKAYLFAKEAHGDQLRKYTKEPYINHPVNVARLLVEHDVTYTAILCAAILHDVVEDTDTTLQDISKEFGIEVSSLVEQVTDISKLEDGNRKTRKRIDREHLSQASYEAKLIKTADILDNLPSIIEHDPKFAKVYVQEKREQIYVIGNTQNKLYSKVRILLDTCPY